MVQGTRVAILVGQVMAEQCRRYKAPADLVDDLSRWTDELIVVCLRSGNSKAERDQVEAKVRQVVETFAVTIGTVWNDALAREFNGDGYEV